MQKYLIAVFCLVFGGMLGLVVFTIAATGPAPKNHDGIVTQINLADMSYIVRLRDGSLVTVKNPFEVNKFVRIRGVLDLTNRTIDRISEIKLKDEKGTDAIPNISLLNPGSGPVGTKITLTGTGFVKKNNSIWLGETRDVVINLPSKDGKTITFHLPAAPCNQRLKLNCPTTVLPTATYTVAVSNENGLSNPVPFTVVPLPPLAITTDMLPQVVGGVKYNIKINAIGGAEKYVWRVAEGNLPPGLLLAQAVCAEVPCKTPAVISGIPTTPGTYYFTVMLTSGRKLVAQQRL
jgi:hypothetical protein